MTEVVLDTAALDAILAKLPQKSEELVAKGAENVLGKAKELAPVDTGALKASLGAEKRGKFYWEVEDGVKYGIYQERGTSKMRAQPFMCPAVEWARPEYNKRWKELFELL